MDGVEKYNALEFHDFEPYGEHNFVCKYCGHLLYDNVTYTQKDQFTHIVHQWKDGVDVNQVEEAHSFNSSGVCTKCGALDETTHRDTINIDSTFVSDNIIVGTMEDWNATHFAVPTLNTKTETPNVISGDFTSYNKCVYSRGTKIGIRFEGIRNASWAIPATPGTFWGSIDPSASISVGIRFRVNNLASGEYSVYQEWERFSFYYEDGYWRSRDTVRVPFLYAYDPWYWATIFIDGPVNWQL